MLRRCVHQRRRDTDDCLNTWRKEVSELVASSSTIPRHGFELLELGVRGANAIATAHCGLERQEQLQQVFLRLGDINLKMALTRSPSSTYSRMARTMYLRAASFLNDVVNRKMAFIKVGETLRAEGEPLEALYFFARAAETCGSSVEIDRIQSLSVWASTAAKNCAVFEARLVRETSQGGGNASRANVKCVGDGGFPGRIPLKLITLRAAAVFSAVLLESSRKKIDVKPDLVSDDAARCATALLAQLSSLRTGLAKSRRLDGGENGGRTLDRVALPLVAVSAFVLNAMRGRSTRLYELASAVALELLGFISNFSANCWTIPLLEAFYLLVSWVKDPRSARAPRAEAWALISDTVKGLRSFCPRACEVSKDTSKFSATLPIETELAGFLGLFAFAPNSRKYPFSVADSLEDHASGQFWGRQPPGSAMQPRDLEKREELATKIVIVTNSIANEFEDPLCPDISSTSGVARIIGRNNSDVERDCDQDTEIATMSDDSDENCKVPESTPAAAADPRRRQAELVPIRGEGLIFDAFGVKRSESIQTEAQPEVPIKAISKTVPIITIADLRTEKKNLVNNPVCILSNGSNSSMEDAATIWKPPTCASTAQSLPEPRFRRQRPNAIEKFTSLAMQLEVGRQRTKSRYNSTGSSETCQLSSAPSMAPVVPTWPVRRKLDLLTSRRDSTSTATSVVTGSATGSTPAGWSSPNLRLLGRYPCL